MKNGAVPFLLAVLLLLGGCGTSRVVRQGNEIAEAGKSYTTAMDALAEYVLDRQIANRFNTLVSKRQSVRTERGYYERELRDTTDDTIDLAEQIGLYRTHTQLLGEYFDALNALVDANLKETGSAATKNAAEGMNAVGMALKTKLNIATEQINALSALGGIVFTEIHGAQVKHVLSRDAQLVAQQIAIQQEALGIFSKTIDRIDKRDRTVMYEREIVALYTKDTENPPKDRAALSPEFKTKWALYVKEPALATQLSTARRAAEKLQEVWKDTLQGKQNVTDLVADSGRLLSAAEQAKALHVNRGKPGAQ